MQTHKSLQFFNKKDERGELGLVIIEDLHIV